MEESAPKEKEAAKIIKDTGLRNIIFNIDTSGLASTRTGGKALCYFKADRIEDLKAMIGACMKNKINFMVVGDCTNILFSDKYINMVLIKLGGGFDYIKSGENIISAGAGCNLSKFIVKAAEMGYDFSLFSGIPGTLGGSIVGNSGSRQYGICDFVKKISYIANSNGDIVEKTLDLDKSHFSYRHLNIVDLIAVTGIVLGADKSDSRDIIKKIAERIRQKKACQPVYARSAGCFFKNVNGGSISVGELIDRCGLRGFIYGGARISDIHANFIENYENASSQDIFVLSGIAKSMVMDKFNKKLDYEVKLIGF